MKIVWIGLAGALAVCVIILLVRQALLYSALREITLELEDRLSTDTNTTIFVSTGSRTVRALAARMNVQLEQLRRERLRLQNGDAELKAAITNVSHDLRTPLTAICGYLELLEREPHTDQSKRYLSVIRERTETMRSLTEELLQYSVATAASDGLREETVSVKSVLEQSLAAFYGVLSERGISPGIKLPNDPVKRTLDSGALRRIFDNILSNAVKYSDGDLTVTLSPEGTVVFSNSARKLGRVQAERLFERFFTVESARGSTGLGLSIAKQLTERMNGSISASYADERLHICIHFPERATGEAHI